MPALAPTSPDELASLLLESSSKSKTISIAGNSSKRLMAGPVMPAEVEISTAGLRRVLQYEKNDLTVSVESGLPFAELQDLLARNGQMIALNPPFANQSTVGGVVASNASGPLRRGFGTVRDLLIGMSFVTLEGRSVKTGGMVVKNVAGLDMGKLMIGSFGTLAVISSVNLRVHSLPAETRTFLFSFPDLNSALGKRDALARSVLQPMAFDLLNPAAAEWFDRRGHVLALQAGGSRAILERYARDLTGSETLSDEREKTFWQRLREFTPDFLQSQPTGVVLRISSTLSEMAQVLPLLPGPCIARAASGVSYAYCESWTAVAPLWTAAAERPWSVAVEFAPNEIRAGKELWLQRSAARNAAAFDIMSKVKGMFDPQNLLNRSRLYGRI